MTTGRAHPPHGAQAAPAEFSRALAVLGLNAIAILGAKAVMAVRDLSPGNPPPTIVDDSLPRTAARILACSAEDGALFLALGTAVAAGMMALGPAGRRRLALATEVLGVALAAYTVFTVALFHEVRHFLTLSLLAFAGWTQAGTAAAAQTDVGTAVALVTVPALVLVAGRFAGTAGRWQGLWHGRRAAVFTASLLVIAMLLGISAQAREKWFFDSHRQFTSNPHLFFVRSIFTGTSWLMEDSPGAVEADPGWVPGEAARLGVAPSGDRQNLVLVIMESVGAQYMSLHGAPWATTPRLTALSERALTFDRFYATAPHTAASALTLFSGIYNDPLVPASILAYPSLRPPTVAEWLQAQGYVTVFLGPGWEAGWGGWSYANLGGIFLARGFDYARDTDRVWADSGRVNTRGVHPLSTTGYPDAAAFEDALRLLEALRSTRFAFIIWTHDTHEPYPARDWPITFDEGTFPSAVFAPPNGKANWFAAQSPERKDEFSRYLQNIWASDRMIGQLTDKLAALGLDRNTVVAVTSDHGESFGQNGWYYHGFGGLYEEDLQSPLLIARPGATPGRTNRLGSHVDLWPTLAETMNITAAPSWQGVSLLQPPPVEEGRVYFAKVGSVGLRAGAFKLVWDYLDGRVSLFDLEADPAEATNLAEARPEIVQTHLAHLRRWVRFQATQPGPGPAPQ